MMVRNHHQHHLMRVPHHVSVPLVNCMELQLRFLCPQDLEQVKLLCRDWFPIEYPDTWYQEITSNPRFFSLAATLSGSIIGLIVAETKELSQLAKEDRSLLASCFLSNTKVINTSSYLMTQDTKWYFPGRLHSVSRSGVHLQEAGDCQPAPGPVDILPEHKLLQSSQSSLSSCPHYQYSGHSIL